MKRHKNIIKKSILSVLIIALISLMYGVTDVRADINGAESQVIAAASSTFYYDGEYYRVKDSYIYQLVNALDSQYDLSQSQANACIDYIYNNVGAGITSGYLYKVEAGKTDEADKPGTDSPQNNVTNPAGNNVGQSEKHPEVIEVDEKTAKKTKEESLEDAMTLANQMGVSIKLDNGKEGITITDKNGNVLISSREAVKNTGFRLNSLVVYVLLIVTAVMALSVLTFKLKLTEQEYEDKNKKTN